MFTGLHDYLFRNFTAGSLQKKPGKRIAAGVTKRPFTSLFSSPVINPAQTSKLKNPFRCLFMNTFVGPFIVQFRDQMGYMAYYFG